MKRLFDFALSMVLLILLSPFMALIALMIKIEDQGKIIYKQKRVKQCGDEFYIYKFRSMKDGSDKVGPYFTTDTDARVTKVGKVIRRLSLDELPQFLNVLKGDMSFVGPRPDVYEQKSGYSEENWKKRHSVKPGITGLAQALLRSSATPQERLSLDLQYVDKQGFFYDLYIIFITFLHLTKLRTN